jgi:arylsulfatase A-like enzyme
MMRGWIPVLLVAALALMAPGVTRAATTKTNVVMIVADDLGYADIGVQAVSKDVRTPNIDSIAKAGARFTAGYVSCPVCSPSRAGFITGRYQERFGYEANPIAKFDNIFGLPLDQATLADEFKGNGYATGAFGKWHLGDRPEFHPNRRGFDEFYGFIGGMHSYTRNGKGFNALQHNGTPVDEKEYLTDALTREAVSFIDRHKDGPFFLYLPYNAVHVPQEAPKKYQDRFPDVADEKRKLMLAMLSAEDDGVGRVLAALHDHGLDENTLVIFFSDNGGPTRGNASRNAPFRGFKGQVWEGGIRIPFMVRWTGRIPAGQVLDRPVISLDIFPTALAAAGIEPRKGLALDGVNLLPWLTGARQDVPHDILYWRFKPAWAVREGDFKLVFAQGEDKPELYDVAKDPGEAKDLATEQPDVAKRLQAKFDAWNAQLMAPRWPGRQEGMRNGKPLVMGIPGLSGPSDD